MPSKGQSFIATWGAWDTTNNKWKVGDAVNQTAVVIKDGAVALPTNTAITELSNGASGAAPLGVYAIALTSAETNFNTIWVGATSSTAAIFIVPTIYAMEQLPVFPIGSPQGLITVGSGAGQMTMSSGFANVDVNQWIGLPPNVLQNGLVQVAVLSGLANSNLTTVNGVAVSANSGFLQVNTAQVQGVAPTIEADGRLTVAVVSGLVNSNVTTVLGQAVAAASGFLQVNTAQLVGVAPRMEADGLTLVAVLSGGVSTVFGNVNGSVGSVVGAVTANVTQVQGASINNLVSGRVDSITNQMGANTIQTTTFNPSALTTTVFAANFLTSALVDATQNNAAADALLDRTSAIEAGLTPRQSWRLVAASQAGVTSGAASPGFNILGAGVTNLRISAVTDQSGNRLAVTLTP